MVVRLDLDEDVDRLRAGAIDARARVGKETQACRTFDHGGVVAVGGQDAGGTARVGEADHREQRFLARPAVDDPIGVEDLVPAVLGIGLREHHQLDIGRLAPKPPEALEQVVHLVRRQRKAQLRVCGLEGCAAARQRYGAIRARGGMREQLGLAGPVQQRRLGHAVAQSRRHVGQRRAPQDGVACREYSMPRSMRRTADNPHT